MKRLSFYSDFIWKKVRIKFLHWSCEQVGLNWDLFRLCGGLYFTGMAHIFQDNMNSSEYQCAQGCYIFLEELFTHMDLRDRNDNLRCAVHWKKIAPRVVLRVGY
jgi:hypothetical protein